MSTIRGQSAVIRDCLSVALELTGRAQAVRLIHGQPVRRRTPDNLAYKVGVVAVGVCRLPYYLDVARSSESVQRSLIRALRQTTFWPTFGSHEIVERDRHPERPARYLSQFGFKVGMAGTVKFEARIRELVENQPDLATWIEPLLIVRRVLPE